MNTTIGEWIEGPLPALFRSAIQAEYKGGIRKLIGCPACSGVSSLMLRYRLVPRELTGLMAARDSVGFRLESYCCKASIIIVCPDRGKELTTNHHVCTYCLQPCDPQ